MKYRVILENARLNRDQFLAARAGKIGGSDMAGVLGLNKYRTRMRIWAEMTGRAKPDPENAQMRYGQFMEPFVAAEFSRETGLRIEPVDQIWQHESIDWLIATPDFLVYEGDQAGALETKTSRAYAEQFWKEGAPDAAHVQAQVQMFVGGLPFSYCAAIIGGNAEDIKRPRFEYSSEIASQLVIAGEQFLELVKSDTPPAAVAEDKEMLNSFLNPRKRATFKTEDPAVIRMVLDYYAVVDRIEQLSPEYKELIKEKERLENDLKMFGAESEFLETPVGKFQLQKVERKGYEVKPSQYTMLKLKERPIAS